MARFLSADSFARMPPMCVTPFARGNDHPLSPTKRAEQHQPHQRDRRQRHGGQPDNNGRRIGRLHFARNWFYPNNMLGEEDVNPRGWHQWQPGERLPTMMTPTIVLKDGNIRLVVGSGGSARIRSAIIQVISNLLDHQLRLIDVVNRPRLHVENGVLQCEGAAIRPKMDRVERMGYTPSIAGKRQASILAALIPCRVWKMVSWSRPAITGATVRRHQYAMGSVSDKPCKTQRALISLVGCRFRCIRHTVYLGR